MSVSDAEALFMPQGRADTRDEDRQVSPGVFQQWLKAAGLAEATDDPGRRPGAPHATAHAGRPPIQGEDPGDSSAAYAGQPAPPASAPPVPHRSASSRVVTVKHDCGYTADIEVAVQDTPRFVAVLCRECKRTVQFTVNPDGSVQ